MAEAVYQKLQKCYDCVTAKIKTKPEIGIVLGSGLGTFAQEVEIEEEISYGEIEGFPVSTVQGHNGKYLFGTLAGHKVALMQGRVHYYEGYDITDVVLPVRLLGMLGVKNMILTNAAGGINPGFQPGILMMITDHISSFVPSPLRGANIEELGTRFPDMSHVGADAVGMSTACEAMALNHMGVKVCGISCITNLAAGMNQTALTHEEVFETANRVAEDFKRLVTEVVRGMH